jgi:hypothetical protein
MLIGEGSFHAYLLSTSSEELCKCRRCPPSADFRKNDGRGREALWCAIISSSHTVSGWPAFGKSIMVRNNELEQGPLELALLNEVGNVWWRRRCWP